MADQPTIGEMIAKHNEIKAFIEAEEAVYNERMKPYRDALVALTTTCGVELQRQGLQNSNVEGVGTAYLQHGDSVTVDNKDDFVKFVLDDHLEFLDARVLKDPARDWLNKHQAVPPGVKIVPFVKCIIRR